MDVRPNVPVAVLFVYNADRMLDPLRAALTLTSVDHPTDRRNAPLTPLHSGDIQYENPRVLNETLA